MYMFSNTTPLIKELFRRTICLEFQICNKINMIKLKLEELQGHTNGQNLKD